MENKAKQDKTTNGNEDPYCKFCTAVDSNCVVSLRVKARLQAENLPGLSFIDIPHKRV